MQYAQLKKIPNVDIDDIYTGNGVSELINLSMSALLDDGDEMCIRDSYTPLIFFDYLSQIFNTCFFSLINNLIYYIVINFIFHFF